MGHKQRLPKLKGEALQRQLLERWNGLRPVGAAVNARVLVRSAAGDVESTITTHTTGLAYIRDGLAVCDTQACAGIPVEDLSAASGLRPSHNWRAVGVRPLRKVA